MFGNWLRKMFAPQTRTLTNGRRAKFRPAVLGLEDRLAPAVVGTLSMVGNTIWYNGTGANNVISVSGTPAALTISDAAGTIQVNAAGFSGNGTGTATGAIPSNVTAIYINGQAGVDTITVPAAGLATTALVQFNSEVMTIEGNVTAGAITLQPNLGGVVNLNGTAALSSAAG